jgi:hypothetical protein
MTPNKCIERQCPRHGVDKNGKDVCILYRVSEAENDLAVIDVFNVSTKQCKNLRESLPKDVDKQ